MAWVNPRTWVSGETVTAALMNTIRDALKAIGDPWTVYTGGDTAVTVGNGTLTKRYMQAGKSIDYSIELTFGSTTAFSAAPRFGLPATPRIATQGVALGQSFLNDASGGSRLWHAAWIATNSGITPLDDSFAGVNATTPWTWATGDELIITGSYEAV